MRGGPAPLEQLRLDRELLETEAEQKAGADAGGLSLRVPDRAHAINGKHKSAAAASGRWLPFSPRSRLIDCGQCTRGAEGGYRACWTRWWQKGGAA
jgi:hypothetical protein